MKSYLSAFPVERVTEAVKSRFKDVLNFVAPLEPVPLQRPLPAAVNPEGAKPVAATTATSHIKSKSMNEPKKSIVNPKTIAASISSSGGPGLKSIPQGKVAKIVSLAFGAISQELEATEQGSVRVQGLGVFRVKNREVEKDGKKTSVRRVGFIAGEPKPPIANSAAQPGNTEKKA